MAYRTLEITLQYAKDLNNVNLITKMDVYAVVSISGGDDKKSRQRTRTPVDHDGGANPTWRFPMKFTVDETALQQNRLMLDIKLACERTLGDKDIGEVNVPVKELLESPVHGAADGKRFVSYQVKKPSGKPKGQLTFSYKFTKQAASHAAPPAWSGVRERKPTNKTHGPFALITSFGLRPQLEDVYGERMATCSTPQANMAYPPVAPGGYLSSSPCDFTTVVDGGGHYAPPLPKVGYGHPPSPVGYRYLPQLTTGYGYPSQASVGYRYPTYLDHMDHVFVGSTRNHI